MYNPTTKIVCTKCGSDEVYIETPEQVKRQDVITIDEMVTAKTVDLVYRPTTWKCKKCGYSVTN